jgi:CheY-like chemotaxis protein
LVIENDPVDALIIRQTLEDAIGRVCILQATDCKQALQMLKAETCKHPHLILLSLDLPGMNGIEFLNICKKRPETKLIPVVVLAKAEGPHTVTSSFSQGAAGYIIKSDNTDEMSEEIGIIARYWSLSRLPIDCGGVFLEDAHIAS